MDSGDTLQRARPLHRLKIVSGGQTGVDRAALDVALELGIRCGGWCPKGRRAEDGPIDEKYPLTETPAKDYAQRTEWNVRDSDGTLILTWGDPTGGTALTVQFAQQYERPVLIIDFDKSAEPAEVETWLRDHTIAILNIAGPRGGASASVYDSAADFLRRLLQNNAR